MASFLERRILAIGGSRRACLMPQASHAMAGIRENITVFWDHDGFPLPEVSCSVFHCERWRELETQKFEPTIMYNSHAIHDWRYWSRISVEKFWLCLNQKWGSGAHANHNHKLGMIVCLVDNYSVPAIFCVWVLPLSICVALGRFFALLPGHGIPGIPVNTPKFFSSQWSICQWIS